MKKRHKIYIKLNLMSLVFIAVSFVSVTLAWFAFSEVSNVETEIDVKAWYIKMSKDGVDATSNTIHITVPDIYPGMEIVPETVNIKNQGDSDAKISYTILSARILNDPNHNFVTEGNKEQSLLVEDKLSHNYPFHININLTKKYALAKTGESEFNVTVSWPLDSGDNIADSEWGTNAYLFKNSGNLERSAIEIVINVNAEQYVGEETASDVKYNLGDSILFDPVQNAKCTEQVGDCINTHIIDVNNVLSDNTVTLLPDVTSIYEQSSFAHYNDTLANITKDWTVISRALTVDDIMKVISTDISNSLLVRNNISDSIIGNLSYTGRMDIELTKVINSIGYYKYLNTRFNYLNPSPCFWTSAEYNESNAFAVSNIDTNTSKVYGELKTNRCNVVPVLVVDKTRL